MADPILQQALELIVRELAHAQAMRAEIQSEIAELQKAHGELHRLLTQEVLDRSKLDETLRERIKRTENKIKGKP